MYLIIDIPEEVPSLSHTESKEVTDSFDSKICEVIKSQSVGRHRGSSIPPIAWFASHLSELDAQLAALQKIADGLEADFHNSRMVNMNHVFLFYLLIFVMTACDLINWP